jgi:hypothetical protein
VTQGNLLLHMQHEVCHGNRAAVGRLGSAGAVAKRAFAAMMELGKIDIAKIEAARRG